MELNTMMESSMMMELNAELAELCCESHNNDWSILFGQVEQLPYIRHIGAPEEAAKYCWDYYYFIDVKPENYLKNMMGKLSDELDRNDGFDKNNPFYQFAVALVNIAITEDIDEVKYSNLLGFPNICKLVRANNLLDELVIDELVELSLINQAFYEDGNSVALLHKYLRGYFVRNKNYDNLFRIIQIHVNPRRLSLFDNLRYLLDNDPRILFLDPSII